MSHQERPMSADGDPFAAFSASFDRATASGRRNMNAMSLATVTPSGAPSVRIVLLRDIDARGFVFFTDARSNKARELDAVHAASACMYWEPIEEQARINGYVERLERSVVETDFASRPRAAQVLIWTSAQSQPLDDLQALRERGRRQDEALGDPVPCPDHWTGYRLVPQSVELWSGSRDRFHTRRLYERAGEAWTSRLLQP